MATIPGTNFDDLLVGVVDPGVDITDIFFGYDGNDTILGLSTNDILNGDNGDDILNGGLGADVMDGGDGNDTASYAGAQVGVTVTLDTPDLPQVTGFGNDVLRNIENLIGSSNHDRLKGGLGANRLRGELGNDTLVASAGNDTLDGGLGSDTADYSQATGPVILGATGVVTKMGSIAGVDRLVSVENIVGSLGGGDMVDLLGAAVPNQRIFANLATGQILVQGSNPQLPLTFTVGQFENVNGSNFDDFITGDAGANVLFGNGGNDTLRGGAGDDFIDGGLGLDTASYAGAAAAVSVSLQFQGVSQSTGGAGSDVLTAVENLAGSGFADKLQGDGGANLIQADLGDDLLLASGGNDTLDGGLGSDTVSYGSLAVPVILGAYGLVSKTGPFAGFDRLVGVETVLASQGGGDMVDHSGYVAPATETFTNLLTGKLVVNGTTTQFPLTLTIGQFESVKGSGFADRIIGDNADNVLIGSAGNDTVEGGNGNDVIDGGLGIDTASYAGAAAAVKVSLAAQGTLQATSGAGDDLLTGFENLQGSGFADSLAGDVFANEISGGLGTDSLTGNLGADVFRFDAFGVANADRILDFTVAQLDRIALNAAVFTGIGPAGTVLAPSQFLAGPVVATAITAAHRILFNTTSGNLFYDRDGINTAFAPVVFATLNPIPLLTNTQFIMV